MSSIESEFKKALNYIQSGSSEGAVQPDNSEKLMLYALFKQITDGPNKTKAPGRFNMVARMKWEAWNKLGTISKEEAMKKYVDLIDTLNPQWRSKSGSTSSPTPKSTSDHVVTQRKRPTGNTFDKNLLKGKVALVTGGGSGICKEITSMFMQYGANVAIIARTYSRLEIAAKELEERNASVGSKCFPVSADVRDYKALEAAFDKVIERYGKIDIMVNGAAGNFLCPAEKLSSNAFKTVLDIDTVGTYHGSKLAFEKSMKKHGGSIINLSMTLHRTGMPLQVHAGCAKGAIDYMTQHLAVEWGLNNVRVNAVAIGPIEGTEGMKRLSITTTPKQFQHYIDMIPIQRMGHTDDIANACLYLVSDAASYVNGAILTVDGGAWFTTQGMTYPQFVAMSKL